MSDELRCYRVEVLKRYAYEVWAVDDEDARRKGIEAWNNGQPAQPMATWPEDYEVFDTSDAALSGQPASE